MQCQKSSWIMGLRIYGEGRGSPQLQRRLFLLKTQKTSTLQLVTGGSAPNTIWKRMLRYFLKTPPPKKILQFQERICFFLLKTQKSTSSISLWWENPKSSFKENARTFAKNSTTQENIKILRLKRMQILNKKENFKPEINQRLKTYKMKFLN